MLLTAGKNILIPGTNKQQKRISPHSTCLAYAPTETILMRPLHNWEPHQYCICTKPDWTSWKWYIVSPPNHGLLNIYLLWFNFNINLEEKQIVKRKIPSIVSKYPLAQTKKVSYIFLNGQAEHILLPRINSFIFTAK